MAWNSRQIAAAALIVWSLEEWSLWLNEFKNLNYSKRFKFFSRLLYGPSKSLMLGAHQFDSERAHLAIGETSNWPPSSDAFDRKNSIEFFLSNALKMLNIQTCQLANVY